MKPLAAIGLLFLLAINAIHINGNQRVSIKVTPAVAVAPAVLTVRAMVEPDDHNRLLTIIVSSDSYQRISELPLEGRNAQRLNVVELRDLPTGLYEVKAVLAGTGGDTAKAVQLVKVQPSPGYSH
jgi:hypothetical protein